MTLTPILDTLGRPTRSTFTNEAGEIVRRCSECGELKTLDGFYKAKADRRYQKAYKCKPCYSSDKAKKLALAKYFLMKKYGMTREDFAAMLAAQGGACAICSLPFVKTPHVDHCHETGKVRGLLCGNCNSMLGHAGDEIAVLQRAIDYLRSAGC